MMLISCWVTKLSEPASTIEDKTRRNEYLSYLLYLLKRKMMHQPFVEEPPSGPLPPLTVDMVKIDGYIFTNTFLKMDQVLYRSINPIY